jgi:hypothetical protein
VFGPAPEGGDGFPPEYFKWLGIDVPARDGDYLIGLHAYVHDKLGISNERLEKLYEVQGRITQRPWVTKECPPIAEWLEVNEKHLATVAKAVKRPEYFNPMCSRKKEGEPSNLIGVLLPSVQKNRELATAFTARAMLRLKEGKVNEAWADLLTCHRLGRLVSRGGTLIEGLVGVAICQIATNATITFAAHPDLTAEQALACLKDVQSLPQFGPLADKIAISERMMGLDALQGIRRNGARGLAELLDGDPSAVLPDTKVMEVVDWTTVMQTMNKGYDRLAGAMRMKDRAARAREFDKIEEELKAVRKLVGDAEKLKKLLAEKDAGKKLGEGFGAVLMALLSPAVQKVQGAHERAEQVSANLQVAFALAAYQKDKGRYPEKLAELAPKYLKDVPGDLFSGKPLVYKPTDKGYLFYSVGVNGKDEGGVTYGEEQPGDDLPVKMPLPELKKK